MIGENAYRWIENLFKGIAKSPLWAWIWQPVLSLPKESRPSEIGSAGYEYEPTARPSWSVGSILEAFDSGHVRAEVEQERQSRIVIVGLRGVGKSSLLNRLRGWQVSPTGNGGNGSTLAQEDLGLFTLVDLPDDGTYMAAWPTTHNPLSSNVLNGYEEMGWTTLVEADLIIFMLDGEAYAAFHRGEEESSSMEGASADTLGLRPAEYQWFCRAHSLGRPLIAALSKADLLDGRLGEVQSELERRLASSVIPVSAQEGLGIETGLLPRMLDACPGLAVPLGREMPAVRRRAAVRLIRRAALLSALTGLEPVPLLDIPVHLTAQMRLLLRLAALHGQLGAGDGNRELLATVAGGLGLRLAVQQVAKLVPVLGWAVSGLLSGLSTWLLGRAAVAYLDGSLRERVPALQGLPKPSWMRQAIRRLKREGKARASGVSHECMMGLASRAGSLAFRRWAANPSTDDESGVSSSEEAD